MVRVDTLVKEVKPTCCDVGFQAGGCCTIIETFGASDIFWDVSSFAIEVGMYVEEGVSSC
jgi:hypothetical protein